MPKTLADMTPEEREQCQGMWATCLAVTEGIIMWSNSKSAYMTIPSQGREQTFKLHNVTPRFDLPRAWTPDGEPVPGEWEHNTAVRGEILDEVYQTTTLNLSLIHI